MRLKGGIAAASECPEKIETQNVAVNPNVAKVEGAAGPRRQGYSCSNLPQALDNAGDAVSSAFPKGKKHDNIIL